MIDHNCKDCMGSRLNIESSHFKVCSKTIHEISNMDILSLAKWVDEIHTEIDKNQLKIANQIIKELRKRLQFIK